MKFLECIVIHDIFSEQFVFVIKPAYKIIETKIIYHKHSKLEFQSFYQNFRFELCYLLITHVSLL